MLDKYLNLLDVPIRHNQKIWSVQQSSQKSVNVYEGNVEYFLFPHSKFTYHLNKWNDIVLSLTLYLLLAFFNVQSLLNESINKRSTIALIHQ